MALVAAVRSDLETFVSDVGGMLERALIAHYGLEVGREATADALAWSVEHQAELATMSNPAGYLYRVGQSAARRHRRQQRPFALVQQPVTTQQVVDVDLQRALLRLTAEQRVAVFLVHSFGFSYRAVAEILGTTPGTVGSHVSRGLARLRELMEQ